MEPACSHQSRSIVTYFEILVNFFRGKDAFSYKYDRFAFSPFPAAAGAGFDGSLCLLPIPGRRRLLRPEILFFLLFLLTGTYERAII